MLCYSRKYCSANEYLYHWYSNYILLKILLYFWCSFFTPCYFYIYIWTCLPPNALVTHTVRILCLPNQPRDLPSGTCQPVNCGQSIFFSHESSCPQTGAELLTRAKAVGADGPFGVVWADVTLLPLLLWKRWIGQRWAFVLWPEGMEDQTWDAAAGASFLRWLLFLFKATSVRAADTHLNSAHLLFQDDF